MMSAATIPEYTQRIRDIINRSRKRYLLSKNAKLWNQMCSSLDVIEDSELAIDAYCSGDHGSSVGAHYLTIYGLLQVLFVQQDAVMNLCESLGISQRLNSYPALMNIRKIRNQSIGHPTKKDKPEPTSYHSIACMTLSPSGFQLYSFSSDGSHESEEVSLPSLIVDQRNDISSILNLVVSELETEEAAHKEKFRMEKLTSLFDNTLNYQVGKVFEGIAAARGQSGLPPAVGELGLQYVKERLQAFRDALAKRGEHDAYGGFRHQHELEYALAELEEFFQNVKDSVEPNINETAAYIFAFFVYTQIAELRQIAEEIDRDYSG